MRYLKLILVLLAYTLITPAMAETCCPAGFVPDFNPSRCVKIGVPQVTTVAVTCVGSSSSSGSVGGGRQTFVTPPQPMCFEFFRTQANRIAATDRCVGQLSANAQLIGCLFEDDAGRAEDARTGLSCPARQSALANQCRQRCAEVAFLSNTCTSSDETWQRAFGDIGGQHFGSAPVERCGSRLATSLANRAARSPIERHH